MKTNLFATLLWTLLPLLAHGDTLIDAHATWNGTGSFGAQLGELAPSSIATVGQTFRVPQDSPLLQRYSIWLSDSSAFEPDPLTFAFHVMEWSGTRSIGPVLYDSGAMTTGLMPHGTWREFRFDNLGLTLTPGNSYVFILSASRYFDGIPSSAAIGATYAGEEPVDAYADGAVFTLDNGADYSQWTTRDWQFDNVVDSVFQAQFVSVPEPSVWTILGAGTIFACVANRRIAK